MMKIGKSMPSVKKQNLKIAFKLALAISETTLRGFAQKHGVSSQAMNQVASGQCSSKRLNSIISRFIKSEFRKAKIIIGDKTSVDIITPRKISKARRIDYGGKKP